MEAFSYTIVDPQTVPLSDLQLPGLESLGLAEKWRKWKISAMSAVEQAAKRWTLIISPTFFYRRIKSTYQSL